MSGTHGIVSLSDTTCSVGASSFSLSHSDTESFLGTLNNGYDCISLFASGGSTILDTVLGFQSRCAWMFEWHNARLFVRF